MAGIDWLKIKNEYIHTATSYRKLAEKHKVSTRQIANRAKAESWPLLRAEKLNNVATKVQQKTEDAVVAQEVKRINRIHALSDRLIDRLEQASEQLETYLVTNRKKTKTVEYDNEVKGKPAKEVTVEEETLNVLEGIVDRQGLKALTAALKDLHSITEPIKDNDNGALETLIRGMQDDI